MDPDWMHIIMHHWLMLSQGHSMNSERGGLWWLEKHKCDVMFTFKKTKKEYLGNYELVRPMAQFTSWDNCKNKWRTNKSLGTTMMDLTRGNSAWPAWLPSMLRWLTRDKERTVDTPYFFFSDSTLSPRWHRKVRVCGQSITAHLCHSFPVLIYSSLMLCIHMPKTEKAFAWIWVLKDLKVG